MCSTANKSRKKSRSEKIMAETTKRPGIQSRYRTHTCGGLRKSDSGNEIRLSGWVHRVRDHGGLLFIDLRDHYGLTQVVADPDSAAFKMAETVRSEWVISVDGLVRERPAGTTNAELPTGEVEVFAKKIEVLSQAKELPLPVFGEPDYPEDTRLKYRFLDLRPYDPADAKYGAPPADYSPPPPPEYEVADSPFGEPLSFHGVTHFAVVSAPENALRPDAGLLALIGRAGPGDELSLLQLYLTAKDRGGPTAHVGVTAVIGIVTLATCIGTFAAAMGMWLPRMSL